MDKSVKTSLITAYTKILIETITFYLFLESTISERFFGCPSPYLIKRPPEKRFDDAPFMNMN